MLKLPIKGSIESFYDWAKRVTSIPFLDGRLVEDLAVTASDVAHDHLLGRTPRGALVVMSSVAQGYKISAFTETTFSISGGSSATVSLWIF